MQKTLCEPKLAQSQLRFRIDLARGRLRAYPLDSLDFIMMDLERPECVNRQAHWCTGDLSGRVLEFLSFSDGVTGDSSARTHELFERILRMRQPDGLFGRENDGLGNNKLLMGLLAYYNRYGDWRALEAAIGVGQRMIDTAEDWAGEAKPRNLGFVEWMTDPFAELYRLTGEARWAKMMERLSARVGGIERQHAHAYLTTLRGLQRMCEATGEARWGERPEAMRRRVLEKGYLNAAGDICEGFPHTSRNEACATADWILLNLNAGFLYDDDEAYAQAEHALLNALYFAQIVTGGMGHRALAPWGYATSEFQEAWWCCTMTGGLAMVDTARHAVTLRGDELRVNFLIPGEFTLPREGREVRVTIATGWPDRAEASICVSGACEGLTLRVRPPKSVRAPKCAVTRSAKGIEAKFSGEIGYTVEPWRDGYVTLQYGELLLSPMSETIGEAYPAAERDNNIPEGYRNGNLPTGWLSLTLPERDENGFYDFRHAPIPSWTYFEEGLNSRTGAGALSVSAETTAQDGSRRTLRFWPLSYAVSTLVFYPAPILFTVKKEEQP